MKDPNEKEQLDADFFDSRVVIPPYQPTEDFDTESIKTPDALHRKAIEYAERRKDSGLSKYRQCYWTSLYSKKENRYDTGMQIHIIEGKKKLKNPEDYKNSYVYLSKSKTLLFIMENQSEIVPILNLNGFKKTLTHFMDTDSDIYSTRHLTWQEIHKLITIHTEHIPHSLPIVDRKLFDETFSVNTNPDFLHGGPPAKPPVIGEKFLVGAEDEIKEDSCGMAYTDQPLEKNLFQIAKVTSHTSPGNFGLFPFKESKDNRKTIPVDYKLLDLRHGFSYKGNETNETRVNNMQTSSKSIPPGFKEMTVWDEEVQDFWRKIVPEDTPELTNEEFQRYSAINPQ